MKLLYWRPFQWVWALSQQPTGSREDLPQLQGAGTLSENLNTALSGGSLGTCVDEERSQLR